MKNLNKAFFSFVVFGSLLLTPRVALASDLVVSPDPSIPNGAHEIYANGPMGQSFVATATNAKVGFMLSYSPASAILGGPNAPIANLVTRLYSGEGMNTTPLGEFTSTVDTTTNGFVDFNLAGSGISLVAGNTYTLGMSIDNRGWINPSVCVYPTGSLPTGAYDLGHPFFNGAMVLDETGICDNSFHITDLDLVTPTPTPTPVVTPTPTPTPVVTPTPTPTPTPVVVKGKKVEGKGLVSMVSDDRLTINGMEMIISPTTVVKLNENESIVVGLRAEYKGYMNSDGTVSLSKIEFK